MPQTRLEGWPRLAKVAALLAVLVLAGGSGRAAMAAAAAPPPPSHAAADLTRLRALEGTWFAARAAHDVAALDRLLAPEFVNVMVNGHLRDKQTVLDRARRHAPAPRHQRLKGLAVQRYGAVAVVSGLKLTRHSTLRFTDIFVWRDNRWQAVRAQETAMRRISLGLDAR